MSCPWFCYARGPDCWWGSFLRVPQPVLAKLARGLQGKNRPVALFDPGAAVVRVGGQGGGRQVAGRKREGEERRSEEGGRKSVDSTPEVAKWALALRAGAAHSPLLSWH
eukprot:7294869-Heterocapsa_arctica.AAC.1